MRSEGHSDKLSRRGMRWLAVLATLAIVAFASFTEAAAQRSRGATFAPRPTFNQRAVRPQVQRVPRVQRVQPVRPRANAAARNVRKHVNRPSHQRTGRSTKPPRTAEKPPREPGYPKRPPHKPREPGEPRDPHHPHHPHHPGGPGIIIGTVPVEPPVIVDPGVQAPPPRQPAANTPPPRRQPPSRATRGPSGAPPPGEQRLVPDQVVAQLPPGTTPQQLTQLEARHNLTRLEQQTFQLTGESMVRWRIPDQRSVNTVIAALENDAGIVSAQPNYLFALQQGTTGLGKGDPAQYAIGKLNLSEAHTLAQGDKVLIGVIDSGIDITHPELAGMVAESFDALPGEAPHSHGTAIAGTIVARARLLGVAPGARILAARAFGAGAATAQATTFNILKGIDWAGKTGARVINMSFAGPQDPAVARELAAASKLNIVLIAAAGNAGAKSPPLYPAADANVIAVSATDAQDRLFEMSNRGKYITVAAPGVDIIAPAPRGAYQITSGTSIAAAYISGLVALLIERSPNLTPKQVRNILETTARDLGARGRDPEFGAGLANAYRALQSLQSPTVDALTSSRR